MNKLFLPVFSFTLVACLQKKPEINLDLRKLSIKGKIHEMLCRWKPSLQGSSSAFLFCQGRHHLIPKLMPSTHSNPKSPWNRQSFGCRSIRKRNPSSTAGIPMIVKGTTSITHRNAHDQPVRLRWPIFILRNRCLINPKNSKRGRNYLSKSIWREWAFSPCTPKPTGNDRKNPYNLGLCSAGSKRRNCCRSCPS